MSEENNNPETSDQRSIAGNNKKLTEAAGAVGDHSALPQDVRETNMKTTTLDDMPKHRCGKPGDRWYGFARLIPPS